MQVTCRFGVVGVIVIVTLEPAIVAGCVHEIEKNVPLAGVDVWVIVYVPRGTIESWLAGPEGVGVPAQMEAGKPGDPSVNVPMPPVPLKP